METISLFTPGPTHIPKRVLQAMSISELHHRTSEFRKLFKETGELLQSLFDAESAPLFLASSGTGGMEAALSNCMGPSDVLGYVDAGKFGERWGEIAKAKSLASIPLSKEWGETISIDELREFMRTHPEITHFAIQYCETSTTVMHDVPAIAKFLQEEFPEILVLVDAISAATTTEISLSDWHYDALVLASQKAFMLPPGLSMLFLSNRYWEKAENVTPKSLYFDLKHERKSQAKENAAWTPVTTVIAGLREALALFEEEGWSNVYARHLACKEFCLEQIAKLDMIPVHKTHGSTSVTGCFLASGYDVEGLRSELYKRSGFRIAGGQDHWKGKVLRFGHMGIIAPEDLARCFSSLAEVMSELGTKE